MGIKKLADKSLSGSPSLPTEWFSYTEENVISFQNDKVLSCLHGNPSSLGTLTGLFLQIAFLSNFRGLKSRAWLHILISTGGSQHIREQGLYLKISLTRGPVWERRVSWALQGSCGQQGLTSQNFECRLNAEVHLFKLLILALKDHLFYLNN